MRFKRWFSLSACAVLLAAAGFGTVNAQGLTTGGVTGVVTGQGGRPIEGAQVEVRNAYASVISPAPSTIEPATRAASVGDGDAALHLWSRLRTPEEYAPHAGLSAYRYAYDLGAEWKSWTGLPFHPTQCEQMLWATFSA